VLGQDAQGQSVADYLAGISRAAGMDTVFRWDGERVLVAPGGKDPMGSAR
jgi:poly-gamma-glutamate synthesis protein (capsule biosynthesis protein)